MLIENEPKTLIRPAKATDVDNIYALIKANSDQGLMLPRSKYKIATRLQGFVVIADEQQQILGCGVLVILWSDLAEIQSLVVAPQTRGRGYGKKIAATLLEHAAALAIAKVLALTYQVEFFTKLGFTIIDKDSIPRKIWGECLECAKLECCDETAMLHYVNQSLAS